MRHHREKGTNVTRTEHSAKTLRPAAGIFATLRALSAAAGVVAVFAGILVLVATAFADGRIGSTESGLGASAAGGISAPRGLATSDKEGGDIYLADASDNQRIDQFEPDGTFVRAFGWGVARTAPPNSRPAPPPPAARAGRRLRPGPARLRATKSPSTTPAPSRTPLPGGLRTFDPSYGDVYVVDQRNFRVEKYGPEGEFLLMFGGEVDQTTDADVCTAADLTAGDTCGAGIPGTGPSSLLREEPGTEAGGFKAGATKAQLDRRRPRRHRLRRRLRPRSGIRTGRHLRRRIRLAADAEPQFVTSLAVDSSGDIYERSVIYDFENGDNSGPRRSRVRRLHALVEPSTRQSGSEPTHIALDP